MSGLKMALASIGGVALLTVAVTLIGMTLTDSDQPIQVAASLHPQPASATDASIVRPVQVADARQSYVIAELYQAYRPAPAPRRAWTHAYDAGVGVCSAEIVLATQKGVNDPAPTATPRPQPAPTYQAYRWGNEFPPMAPAPPYPPDSTGASRDPNPTAAYPTPYPTDYAPTPTPYPTPTLEPLRAGVSWMGWENRPLAIETAGMASLAVPQDAVVRSYLEVRTGLASDAASQTLLMRSPTRDAVWSAGRATIRLDDASGRIVLPDTRTAIDAHYRSALLNVQVAPADRCDTFDLRWEQPAAIVVKALTEQPFSDWTPAAMHPQTPSRAFVEVRFDDSAAGGQGALTFIRADGSTEGPVNRNADYPPPQPITVYAARSATTTFRESDFRSSDANLAATATGDGSPLALTLSAKLPQTNPRTAMYIGFAVPADVTIASISSNSLPSEWCGNTITDCAATTGVTINGAEYKYVVSSQQLFLDLAWTFQLTWGQ